MSHITLTAEQTRVVLEASGPVEVRDEQERTVGCLSPLQPEPVEQPMAWPWNKARHKIRAAAKAYSEQTHADN